MVKIIESFENLIPADTNGVVAIGNFDGIHLGHQEIIKTAKFLAQKNSTFAGILTFEPHPKQFFNHANIGFKPFLSFEDKTMLMTDLGIDKIYKMNFNHDVANLSAEAFINFLLNTLKVRHIVTGYNYMFGKGRSGNTEMLHSILKKHGVGYSMIEKIIVDEQEVSSSNIKRLLEFGYINRTAELLGRQFSMRGKVVKGTGRGKELNYPTANIDVDTNFTIPLIGVYMVKAHIPAIYNDFAIANLGTCPTFGKNIMQLEVHLLNFEDEIYDKEIDVTFYDLIRPQRTFKDKQALQIQIQMDIRAVNYLIKNS